MSTDPTTDRPRALHLLEAADFLRDAHFRDGLSVQEIGTALRHMADDADPMVGSLARDGFGLDEIAAMPAAPVAAPPTGQADEERARISAKLWQIAEHHIVAEWICCEPLEPRHTLCAKGHAALGMAKTLLVDSPEAWNPAAPLLDAVLAELEQLRRERDLAIAHDRQPYPTAWAYEQACAALHRKEAAIERVRAVLETEAVVGRSALEYRGLITSALLADEEQQAETQAAPADPWEVAYHRMSPARLNAAVCICGLGPDALVHNEPAHACSSRPTAPHHVPVAGLCTLCHHHETAACHTAVVAEPGKENSRG